MSMSNSTLSAARRNPNRIYMALMLAHNVQQQREALGLSVSEAAYISGIAVSRWCALEGGWVPADEDAILRSVAEDPGGELSPGLLTCGDQPPQPAPTVGMGRGPATPAPTVRLAPVLINFYTHLFTAARKGGDTACHRKWPELRLPV